MGVGGSGPGAAGRGDGLAGRLYGDYARHAEPPTSLEGLAPRAPYLRALVRRHLPADRASRILDLGCGHGALVHFAREAGYDRVRGVDASAEQVAAARALGIEGVEHGDLLASVAALPDASQDVVVAFDVVEHLDSERLIALVDHVRRVLAPGGRWILHVPNGESPLFGRIRYGDLTHRLAFTRRSLRQLLHASGFEGVACFEDRPVVHGPASAARAVLWRVIRGLLGLYLRAETGESPRDAVFSQSLLAVAFRAAAPDDPAG